MIRYVLMVLIWVRDVLDNNDIRIDDCSPASQILRRASNPVGYTNVLLNDSREVVILVVLVGDVVFVQNPVVV